MLYELLVTIGILAVLASIYSNILALRFDRQVSDSLERFSTGYAPRACVIMACKGEEQGLGENIEAILTQTYPNYRTIIIADSTKDPAYPIARTVLANHPTRDAHLYTADIHPNASGKVAALLTALERDGWASDAYAFVDSDALTPKNWLTDIVGPLHEKDVGAATGFRWYFSVRGGFWSHVASAWNASGTNVMFDERYNFPWGGAMAILGRRLKEVDIQAVWERAISDDLTLNMALRERGYRTIFLPQCIVATFNETAMRPFLGWATRQVTLTKAFNRQLWNYGLAAYAFFSAVMALGVVSLIATITSVLWLVPAALLLLPSILGTIRSSQRITTLKRALPAFSIQFDRTRWADSIASLIVPWIMTYCIIKSARIREIEWRGRTYKISGPSSVASS